MDISDDEFDHVRDFDMSEPESDVENDTPATTPSRTHTTSPAGGKVIPCPYDDCTKTFNRNARLQEHIRSHTGERPFKCHYEGCDKAFLRDTHLKHHLVSAHSDVRKYECTWEGCEKKFATGTRLRRHLEAHEGREKHRCRGYDGCNETFRKHETLRRHVLAVHENKKPFTCERELLGGQQCGQSYGTSDGLRNHERTVHDDPTKFTCTVCTTSADIPAVSFETYHDLQEHIQQNHLPTCEVCAQSFNSNKDLSKHMEMVHGQVSTKEVKQIPCTYTGCHQIFSKKSNLSVHIKSVHQKRRDFVCGVTEIPLPEEVSETSNDHFVPCGRDFTSKASLVEHIRVNHFQLKTKRQQRESNKRARREVDDNLSDAPSFKKPRKPRKDKGVRKISTLKALTGTYDTVAGSPMDSEMDGSNDWNQLSGSMTMFGEHLYHHGRGYQLMSEDGSVDQYLPDLNSRVQHKYEDMEIEPFFQFEYEREMVHPDNIDPLLQDV